ncbi:unnamed protein product, partial [Ceratitis capitata]
GAGFCKTRQHFLRRPFGFYGLGFAHNKLQNFETFLAITTCSIDLLPVPNHNGIAGQGSADDL